MDDISNDGWQIFRQRKNKRKAKFVDPASYQSEGRDEDIRMPPLQRDQLYKRITSLICDLEDCVQHLFDSLEKLCPSVKFRSLVCYGTGSPVSSHESRSQLALIIGLRSKLKESATCSDMSCYIFDPILSEDEYDFLNDSFHLQTIRINEECRKTVDEATLFFMPHLDAHFYNNLLEANWQLEKLKNVYILGNSLRYITESATSREADKQLQFITRVSSLSMWNEVGLSNYEIPRFESSFNQLALQGLAQGTCDEDEMALATVVQLSK